MNRLSLTIALVIIGSASYLTFGQEQPPPPPVERAAQDQPPPPPADPADRDRADRDRAARDRADRADRAAPSPSDKFAPGPVQGPTQAPIQAPLPPKAAAYQAPQQGPKQAPVQAPMQKGGPVQKGGGYTAGAEAEYRSYSYEPGFSDYESTGWYDGGGYYRSGYRMGNRPAWRNAAAKATGRY